MYLGDFKEDGDLFFKFTTRRFSTGAPTTLANTPVLSVYIDEATATEKTTAEAYFDLDVDFDSKTGLNNVRIDLSGDAFFATGADYTVVITTGTVDSVSVIGEVVATFSIENRSMGQPAGATLSADVAAIKTEVDKIGTIPALDSAAQTIGAAIGKLADDNAGADFDATTDSLEKVRNRGDAAWITATGFNTTVPDAAGVAPTVAEIQAEMEEDGASILDTLRDKFVGITLLNEWLGAIAGKQNADATALTEIKASGAGSGTYDPNTDSTEAIRDRGDAAWPTATGFSTHSAADVADAVQDEPIEDHDTQGNVGWATALAVYSGSEGPGIYIDSGAANTSTVVGTDGTEINPVSTFAAARTLADALGLKIYYLEGNSDITLAATHEDWEFIGIGSVADNVVNLGSQDVDRSLFRNLTVEGTQGGTGRITARDCALQDPGAGDTTLHIFAERCGFVDRIQVDTSADNVFDSCFSLVAGTAAPVVQATGAAGTISIHHYSGGLEFETLSASHNVTWEGIGQVIFNADCNVNANVSVRGIGSITDNTGGMSSLTETSLVNMTKINTEADTALSDYDGPTKAEMDTGHALLATEAKQDIIDTVVDAIKVVTDKFVFTVANLVNSNVKAISDDTTAADNLEALMDGVLVISVNDASATTTAFATDGFTEATDDHFNGRLMTFITGALLYQQTDITGYDAASGAQGAQEFTVTALTEAPAEDVQAIIH